MKSKGYLRFHNRIDYFDIDLELIDMVILNQKDLADEQKIFKNITEKKFPHLSNRKNTHGSRKIILEHLRTTVHISFIKEIYEEITEYIQYIVSCASKSDKLDIKRFIGNNKIQLGADEVISAGNWNNITDKISNILFKQLESERSTMRLIQEINKKLNLDVDNKVIEKALPYLEMRHSFVHQNGKVDKSFIKKYPELSYKKNKIVLKRETLIIAKENIIKLAQAFDKKMIEYSLFSSKELQP